MAIIGVLGIATGMPWLFPSLGPTIAIQSEMPEAHVARPWNVIVGHFIGAATGIASVHLTGVIDESPVNVSHALTAPRVLAASLAVLASMALQRLCKAQHAPAQATTLLVVMGALAADIPGVVVLACGIVLVALLGEGVRQLRLSR
jgi:hypothetical protein